MYFNLQICNVIKKKYGTSTKPPKGCLPSEMNVTNYFFQNALKSKV